MIQKEKACEYVMDIWVCTSADLCAASFLLIFLYTSLCQLVYFRDLGMASLVNWSVHHFGPDWNISTTIGWAVVKFCTDIHASQRMNPTDFDDSLTFPLVPPWGWHFWSLMEYLSAYWMYCPEIWYRYPRCPEDESGLFWWSPDFSFSATSWSELSLI